MMTRHGILLCCVLSMASCVTTKPSEEDKAKPRGPELVGRIASVPRSRSFVLIQSYGPWTVPPASVLTSRGEDGRTANLRFTGETLGQFAAADIQAGEVEKGDAVYSHHVPKPPPVSISPSTQDFPVEPATSADLPTDLPPLPTETSDP